MTVRERLEEEANGLKGDVHLYAIYCSRYFDLFFMFITSYHVSLWQLRLREFTY